MLISINWIQQYLNTIDQVDATEVANKLTNSLAEVEQIIPVGQFASNIVIGEIEDIKPHPSLKKLQVCKVKIKDKSLTIATTAKNIFKQAKVVVCLPNGTIHNPDNLNEQIKIEPRNFKGITSEGMFCSFKELGLSTEHNEVIILPKNEVVGQSLDEYIKDQILEIENKSLTHRPDCFSHLGIAREIAALLNLEIQLNTLNINISSDKQLPLTIDIKEKNLCPRFSAIVLSDVSLAPSPFWIQARLVKAGINPINNIIDITNYIALDIGQPMHAFDYDKIKGNKITLRKAKKNEAITTLDEKKYKLNTQMLILADKKGPIAIAGIMGGQRTSINKDTKNIILIAENLDMYSIRRTSRLLGLRTQASIRFEKGLSPTTTTTAIKDGSDILLDISTGEYASEIIDIINSNEALKEKTLEFNLNYVSKILGIEITKEEIINILESLQIRVIGDELIQENNINKIDQANIVTLKVPDYRQDLHIPEDIVEEIARIYGYNKLMPTLPIRDLRPTKINQKFKLIRHIKKLLSSYGLYEIYSYPMIGTNLAQKAGFDISQNCIKIKNPLSPDLEYVRNNLTPSLLEKLELNFKNKFNEIKLFELTKVSYKEFDKDNKLPIQPHHLAFGINSTQNTFKLTKGILEQLFDDLNIQNYKIERFKNQKIANFSINSFHPMQSAIIKIENRNIGIIGNIHPMIIRNFNLQNTTTIAEINIDNIISKIDIENIHYKHYSIYPSISRDLSFWINKDIEVGEILNEFKHKKVKYLTNFEIKDIYFDKKDTKRKSITITISFQSLNKTLTNNDIKVSLGLIQETIERKFNAKLRS